VLRTTADGAVRVTVQAAAPTPVVLTSGDSRVEAVVGRRPVELVVQPSGPAAEVMQNAGSVIGAHGLGMNRGYHSPLTPELLRPIDVPAWCGAAVLLRSDYLRDVGLLDERWFLYYEDTDLAWRGLLRGWRYGYVPTARVRHAHSTTIGHGSGLYDVQHGRNRVLTVTKCAPLPEVAATWGDALRLVPAQLRGDVVARIRDRRMPEPVLTARRLRALASAARVTPSVLRDRTSVRGAATVPDGALPVLGRWREPAGPEGS
jgi:hypothetical protein